MTIQIYHFMCALDTVAALTFGRDTARIRQLIDFLMLFSMILWGIVLVTAIFSIAFRVRAKRRKKATIVNAHHSQ